MVRNRLNEQKRILRDTPPDKRNREGYKAMSVAAAAELGKALLSNNSVLIISSLCTLSALFGVWYDYEVGIQTYQGKGE